VNMDKVRQQQFNQNQNGEKKDSNKKDKNKTNDKNKNNNQPGNLQQQKDDGQQPQQVAPGQLLMNQLKSDTTKNSISKNGKKSRHKKPKEKKVKQPKEQKQLPQVGTIPKIFFRLLTALKRANFQYNEDFGTTLPGYMDSTKLVGLNFRSMQPGIPFLLGYQPDTNWINRFGSKGLLSRDSLVSDMIRQRYNQRFNITAQVSPFRDFNIDVSVDKTFDKQYSELYKDTTGHSGLTRLNPYATGSFSISYIAFQTLFKPFNPNEVSATFQQFEANRLKLSSKLQKLNPYAAGSPLGTDGYYAGYGRYAQDVIIPAFIGAYTNKDPLSVKLGRNDNPNIRSNPYAGILPKPNWTLNYNGLSKVPGFDKIFTSFVLRHGYHSTFSMNSFNTALLFTDPLHVAYPSFRDTLTGNYIPYFLVPNITIQESFDPLVGLEMTFTNQMTVRFEYKKTRMLSLSLVDYQLAENHSTEMTFGFDWRRKGVPLVKKLPFMKGKLDNDLTFKLDFSLRDDATANTKLDQGTSFGTGGQKVVHIAPSVDYVINSRVSIKLFFDQTRSTPKISSSFPVISTKGGAQVRISLTQ
jgi:cell surface protein SprA